MSETIGEGGDSQRRKSKNGIPLFLFLSLSLSLSLSFSLFLSVSSFLLLTLAAAAARNRQREKANEGAPMRLVHSIGIVRGRAGGPAPRVEQARGARSHLLFDRVLHVARRNNGKTRARRCGAGRLEHHFRLSISRSPKGLLSPIAHAHCRVQCRRLHFGAFRAQAIIDEENRPRRRVRRPARAESSVSPAIISVIAVPIVLEPIVMME